LVDTKQRVFNNDPQLALAVSNLKKDADSALLKGPWSVMDKKITPPSGSKHDYYSIGIYWWPCNWNDTNFEHDFGDYPKEWFAACDKVTGLPWVRRDGIVDPLTNGGDPAANFEMIDAVTKLCLGYYFLNDEKYAARASMILKTWFLDASTHMNPNLNFGQGVPGVTTGRGEGLIETRGYVILVNTLPLLMGSQSWNETDDLQMKQWFSDFLNWMITSTVGNEEASATNNHGSWYDTQASGIALYVGRKDIAQKIAQAVPTKRIMVQIEVNGTLPQELARTQSFSYSYFDIQALFYLASLTPESSVELFNYSSPDGRSIKKAFDFLVPYAIGAQKWPYQQITQFNTDNFFQQLRMASIVWNDPAYEKDITKLPHIDYTGNYSNTIKNGINCVE